MAQALGARVLLITGVHPGFDRSVFAGLDLASVTVPSNPRYENTYDSAGNRTQRLIDPGSPLGGIDWQALPRADVLILAPAYHELASWPPVESGVAAVSLQGALRSTTPDTRVVPIASPENAAMALCPPHAFVFFSEEDTPEADALASSLAARGLTVVVTRGYHGATLFRGTAVEPHSAIPTVRMVDPTGAGDCFSTTFIVRYAETGDTGDAMRYALAAGALAVEGDGLAAVPTRQAIEQRLAQVAA